MNKKIIDTLQSVGLSDKEAQIYVSLLELELATVFEISKHSGLNRSSTYVVLESLKKKGLAGTSPDKKVVQYFASSPDSLLHSVKSEAKKQEEASHDVESILPELRALHKDTKHRPKVKIYEGKSGVQEVFYNLFEGKVSDLKTYANASKMFEFFPDLVLYNKKRAEMGIKMYAVNPASEEMVKFIKNQKHSLPNKDELLLIPEEKFKFPVNVGIYGDRVTLISMKGEFGILIENKDVANTLRNTFDLAWEEAKRLDKEIKAKYF